MKKIILLVFLTMQFYCATAQQNSTYDVKLFSFLPKLQIRALEVISESKVWFAADRGVWGYTEDAGASWHIDSMKIDNVYPEFRSIASLNDSTFLLLSIVSPAYLVKTTNKGKTWKLVYKNVNEKIFFDCLKFYNKTSGIAIADPIDGHFPIIKTDNGGETWTELALETCPSSEPEEGIFAASNTSIDIQSKNTWFISGGSRARLFYSNDQGVHFKSYDQPILPIEQMNKNGTIDFINSKLGVMGGGNSDNADTICTKLAITKNRGDTWETIKTNLKYSISCVQFHTKNEFYFTSYSGTFKYSIKSKTLTEIKGSNGKPLRYYTLRITPSGNAMWLAGGIGTIALINLKPKK